MASGEPRRFGHHDNAFGFLRLLLASLVIVSHTTEIVYGDRSHEPLTLLFGTISFGDFAVYGFFIISGFLITGSFLKSPSALTYLLKRVARIYPGFLVAFIICVLIVAPLGGEAIGAFDHRRIVNLIFRAAILQEPTAANAFAGSHFPVLNGSMWTIAYEFRCYLLVAILGLMGVLRHRWAVAAITLILLLLLMFTPGEALDSLDRRLDVLKMWVGKPSQSLILTVMFLSGALFYLFKEEIRINWTGASISLALLIAGLFFGVAARPAVAIFGAYLIFAIAYLGGGSVLARINNDNDISYGVYLYAWPLTKLLDWWWPGLGTIAIGLVAWLGAMILGAASWFAIEKPVMRALQSALRSNAGRAPQPA